MVQRGLCSGEMLVNKQLGETRESHAGEGAAPGVDRDLRWSGSSPAHAPPGKVAPGAPGAGGLPLALALWRLCGLDCPLPLAWGGTGRGQAAGGARTDLAGVTPGAAQGQGSQWEVGSPGDLGSGYISLVPKRWKTLKKCGQTAQELPRWRDWKTTHLPKRRHGRRRFDPWFGKIPCRRA